jgi:hypothetical protein
MGEWRARERIQLITAMCVALSRAYSGHGLQEFTVDRPDESLSDVGLS